MALLDVHHYSTVLNMNMDMRVILPEKDAVTPEHPAKALYLLHGMGGDHTIWTRKTSIERYVEQYNVAVFMPETHLGWYTDMARGFRYFTYMTEELPVLIKRMFVSVSDKKEDTFVAGFSMGGYGAIKCALKAGHLFSKAAALSGAVDIATRYDAQNMTYWEDIFGAQEKASGSCNDLFRLAQEMPKDKRPPLYLWCGTDDFLYQDNVRFVKHLRALGYDVTWDDGPGGHTWDRWDEQIQPALKWLLEEQ